MAIKLLQGLFGHASGVIVKDIGYDIEKRLVEKGLATYTLTGGTAQLQKTVDASLSSDEQELLIPKNGFDISDEEIPAMAKRNPFNGRVRFSGIAEGGTDRSVLLVGDSITNYNRIYTAVTSTGGHILEQSSVGFFHWANSLLGKRFSRIVVNASSGLDAYDLVRGSHTDPNATLQNYVIAPDVADVFIFLGVNDIGSNRSADQICADLLTIHEAAHKSGKRVTFGNIPPRRTGEGAYTAAQTKVALLVNEWLAYQSATRYNFGLVDFAGVMTDYSLLTAWEAPATTGRVYFDELHPNNRGGYLMGKAVADWYRPITQPLVSGPLHYIDDSTNDTANRNLLDNGMFAGTLGAGLATGWTGPSAAGVITAVTNTIVAAPDGKGQAQQIDVTVNAAGQCQIYANWDNTPALVAGDVIFAEIEYTISGNGGSGVPSGVQCPFLKLDVTGGAQPSFTADLMTYSSGTHVALPGETISGKLRTAPYRVTGAETSLNNVVRGVLYFAGAGSARVTWSKARVVLNRDPYAGTEVWQ